MIINTKMLFLLVLKGINLIYKFLYINVNKINQIINNKNLFKQYLVFWMSKLFVVD